MRNILSGAVFVGLLLAASAAQTAEIVVDALARPAIAVRHPERSVVSGAALAGARIVAVGERGLVLVSENGGRQWRQASSPVSVGLTAVRFADDRFGVAVGHGGSILTTTDAGNSWTLSLDGRRAAQIALDSANARKDANAVREAQRLVDEGPDKPFLDVLMLDGSTVLVVGAYGLAFASPDRGRTWHSWMDRFADADGLHLYAVRRRGDVIVAAGEQGLVLRSADAGRSFERLETPYEGSFFTVELPVDDGILLAGLRGNVWHSRDAGRNWQRIASPMPASVTASALAADGAVLLATQAGFVLTLDAGGSLQPVNAEPLPPISHVLRLGDGRLLASSNRGVVPLDPKTVSKKGVR